MSTHQFQIDFKLTHLELYSFQTNSFEFKLILCCVLFEFNLDPIQPQEGVTEIHIKFEGKWIDVEGWHVNVKIRD